MKLEEILRAGLPELGLSPDEDAVRRLGQYAARLQEKNAVMNLTAIKGEEDTARLHFLDCAALLALPEFAGRRLVDVGSGAGFPGLVLKILRPELETTLLDSLDKRVSFLRETGEALGLTGVTCLHGRAEEASDLRERFDLATARAVTELGKLCELCLPLVKVGGAFLAMKGPQPEAEVQSAARAIRLLGGGDVRTAFYTIPGTDVRHSVIVIRKLSPTPSKYPRRWAQIKKASL